MKNITKFFLTVYFGLFLVFSLSAKEEGDFAFARIKNKGASLREAPNFRSKLIFKLRSNRIVRISKRSSEFYPNKSGGKKIWYKVLTLDNREGFVYGEEIEVARPEKLKKRDFGGCKDCPEYDAIGMDNYLLRSYPKEFRREGNILFLNLKNGTSKKFVSTMDDSPENNLGFGSEGEAFRLVKYSFDFEYAKLGVNDGGEEGYSICIDMRIGSETDCGENEELYFSPDGKKVLKLGIEGEGPGGVYYVLIQALKGKEETRERILKTKSHEFYKIPHDLLVRWKTSQKISVMREIPYNDTSAIYSYSELVYKNGKWIYEE